MAAQEAEAGHDPEKGWGWMGISWLYGEYMWVWLALLILTLVEVIVPEPHNFGIPYELPRIVVIVSLIGMALVKTWLVAWYYMHLIAERPAIILVAATPFLFSLFLVIGIWPWRI